MNDDLVIAPHEIASSNNRVTVLLVFNWSRLLEYGTNTLPCLAIRHNQTPLLSYQFEKPF